MTEHTLSSHAWYTFLFPIALVISIRISFMMFLSKQKVARFDVKMRYLILNKWYERRFG